MKRRHFWRIFLNSRIFPAIGGIVLLVLWLSVFAGWAFKIILCILFFCWFSMGADAIYPFKFEKNRNSLLCRLVLDIIYQEIWMVNYEEFSFKIQCWVTTKALFYCCEYHGIPLYKIWIKMQPSLAYIVPILIKLKLIRSKPQLIWNVQL